MLWAWPTEEIGPNMHCVNLDVIRPRSGFEFDDFTGGEGIFLRKKKTVWFFSWKKRTCFFGAWEKVLGRIFFFGCSDWHFF